MSDASQGLWYDNTNGSEIPSPVYSEEKAKFAGDLSCAILYGVVVILFFQCMEALFNPINRAGGGIKQLLVVHTVSMFSFVTVYTVANLNILSDSYIDNREFPGTDSLSPGPYGYQDMVYSDAAGVVSTVMVLLNNWLADGLLIYRCYIIYRMDYWVIFLPCLMYLATFGTGAVLVYYQISQPNCTIWSSTTMNIGVPYSISVSLDVLVTLMIVARLVLLSKKLQSAMNVPFRLSGLYKAVIMVVSESSAIYAVTFLLFIGTWATNDPTQYFFWPILAQAQVIAPFLIILQVANRKAVTSEVTPVDISSLRMRSAQSMDGARTSTSGYSDYPTVLDGETPRELQVDVVTTTGSDNDKT